MSLPDFNTERVVRTYSDGELLPLQTSGVLGGSIAVNPSDDSFFATDQRPSGGRIVHYDRDGKTLETVAQDLQGCFQVLLDHLENLPSRIPGIRNSETFFRLDVNYGSMYLRWPDIMKVRGVG